MADKELFIQAVQMVEVDGSTNIPTAVLYEGERVLVGNEALANTSDFKLVNEDFKIDLGRYAPGVQTKHSYDTAIGRRKTAVQIADDFLYEVQKVAKSWLTAHGLSDCKHVVIAEPLSMHTEEVSPEWLANYRSTLRRLLEGKTVLAPKGVEVRFIPEPFAAFQYYRHGIRHPLVYQRRQMNALVIDFGGGTCDVCIIQTTKEGDISGGGVNKRPLAGKSLPVGGYTVNRTIAEHLVKKVTDSAAVKTALREYKDWLEGRRSIDALDPRYKQFIDMFHRLVHKVEHLKLTLSRATTDWSLTAEPRFSASVAVPTDPFVSDGKQTFVSMSVAELREVFIQKIYLPLLKPFFTARLEAGRDVLEGAPLTMVLLSGGSANFGWLEQLLKKDFSEYLRDSPFVKIPDYQQVVAQGLAVDCAREFATGSSDFKGVTYNPLFLLLDADESSCEPRPFIARTAGLPDVRQRPGLLLPTASVIGAFVDQPMEWRVKLNRSPHRRLDYFFLQPSMDLSDIKNLQNVEETVVHTPKKCEFDSSLYLRLTIRKEDGTALPEFIYRAAGPGFPEKMKAGKRFVLDMTDAGGGGGEAYLGLDFGTSNTALCYVDRSWVQVIETRSQDSGWKEIGDLIDVLPSPLAVPLALYLGDHAQHGPVPPGYSFIEAALCLAAYVSYIELCCTPRRATTRIFKEFPHRSAGYLWHMLKTVQQQLGSHAVVSQPFKKLCTDSSLNVLDRVTRSWAEVRHELSLSEKDQLLTAVRVLANACNAVFSSYKFGYMEAVQRERFSNRYSGRFRVAHGKPPHSSFLSYSGARSFSEAEALIINPKSGTGLLLTPLVLWYPCPSHVDSENGHCFFFDKLKGKGSEAAATYKAASFPCVMPAEGRGDTSELLNQLLSLSIQDQNFEQITGLSGLNEGHGSI